MKYLTLLILSFFLLLSCTSFNQSKDLNIQNANEAYSKFHNISNNLSYDEYKLLVVEYGINSKFPDINK